MLPKGMSLSRACNGNPYEEGSTIRDASIKHLRFRFAE